MNPGSDVAGRILDDAIGFGCAVAAFAWEIAAAAFFFLLGDECFDCGDCEVAGEWDWWSRCANFVMIG